MADIKFNGIDDLRKQLQKNMNMDDVKKVVKANGADLQQLAQRNASFRGHTDSTGRFIKPTGTTKRSIHLEIRYNGMAAHVAPTTHYSPYLEHGTRFMSAQPFMRPAFFYQRYQFIKEMQQLMK